MSFYFHQMMSLIRYFPLVKNYNTCEKVSFTAQWANPHTNYIHNIRNASQSFWTHTCEVFFCFVLFCFGFLGTLNPKPYYFSIGYFFLFLYLGPKKLVSVRAGLMKWGGHHSLCFEPVLPSVAQTPSLLSYLSRSFGHVWGFGEHLSFTKTLVNLGWWKTGEGREREREREEEEASKYVSHVQALRNCAKRKRFFF